MKKTMENKKLMKLIKHIAEEIANENTVRADDEYLKKLALDFAKTQKNKEQGMKLADARKKLLEENELMLRLIWIVGGGAMFQVHIIKFFNGILSKNTIISNLKKLSKYETTENITSAGNNVILLKYSAIKYIAQDSNPETVKFDRNLYFKSGYFGAMFLKRYEGYEYQADKLVEFEKLSREEQQDILVTEYRAKSIKELNAQKKEKIYNEFCNLKSVSEINAVLRAVFTNSKEDLIEKFQSLPIEEQINLLVEHSINTKVLTPSNVEKLVQFFKNLTDDKKLNILQNYQPMSTDASKEKLQQFIKGIQRETTMTKTKDAEFIAYGIENFTKAREQYEKTADKLTDRNKAQLTLNDFDTVITRFEQETRLQDLKSRITTIELVNVRKPKGLLKKLKEQKTLQDEKQEAERQKKIAELENKISDGIRMVEDMKNEIFALKINKCKTEDTEESIGDSLMTMRNHSVFIESLTVGDSAQIKIHLVLPDFISTLYTDNIEAKVFNTYNFLLAFFNLNKEAAFQLNMYFTIYVSNEERKRVILKQLKDIRDYLNRRNLSHQAVDNIKVEDLNLTKTIFNNQKF